MKKFLIVLLFLTACGEEKENEKNFFYITDSFCDNHFGLKTWDIQGNDLKFECNDGTNAHVVNYIYDLEN